MLHAVHKCHLRGHVHSQTQKLAQLKMTAYQNSRNQKHISNVCFTNGYSLGSFPELLGIWKCGFLFSGLPPFLGKNPEREFAEAQRNSGARLVSRVLSKEETLIPLFYKTRNMASAGFWKGLGWREQKRQIIWDTRVFRDHQWNSRVRFSPPFSIKSWHSRISLALLSRFNSSYQLRTHQTPPLGNPRLAISCTLTRHEES